MARTRRIYTPEFKAEAVKLVTEQGYSIAEAARSLGINAIGGVTAFVLCRLFSHASRGSNNGKKTEGKTTSHDSSPA
jgi:hypothetical protein